MIQAIVFDCYGVLVTGTMTLNQPVVDLIATLRPRYKVGLLSNAHRQSLDRLLGGHHVAPLFDVVLGSSETAFAKPERQIFELMGQRLDVPLSGILFIDDSPQNTAAAHSYGMQVITYRDPHQLQAELPV